jgi:hypothetical protein
MDCSLEPDCFSTMNLLGDVLNMSLKKFLPLQPVSNWEWEQNYGLETSMHKEIGAFLESM